VAARQPLLLVFDVRSLPIDNHLFRLSVP